MQHSLALDGDGVVRLFGTRRIFVPIYDNDHVSNLDTHSLITVNKYRIRMILLTMLNVVAVMAIITRPSNQKSYLYGSVDQQMVYESVPPL